MHNTIILALLLAAGSCMQSFSRAAEPAAQSAAESTAEPTAQSGKPWLGLHVLIYNADDLEKVRTQIPALAKSGVNVLILETDYNFEFASHPELNTGKGVTRQQAREIGDLCRKSGIRPIPQINCLGHQSWAKETGALLVKHPEFDETIGKYPNNEGIYCRSWCPQNPEVNKFVFDLMDELIDAFGADAFHAGMDEVFIIGSDDCPRCKGHDPAKLFAKAVNDIYNHLVKEKKVEMFMWADRLLDAKAIGASKWEASANGTWGAIDRIPKDIVQCDWHYEKQADYKSIPLLLDKGFRVWPSGWNKIEASEALLDYSLAQNNPRMLGYLSTTWSHVKLDEAAAFPPTLLAAKKLGITPEQGQH